MIFAIFSLVVLVLIVAAALYGMQFLSEPEAPLPKIETRTHPSGEVVYRCIHGGVILKASSEAELINLIHSRRQHG